ncbi:AraC family transcriptional regulator [Paenibacillus eucommiae]|uniref:AraC-like DNA-binding protein n=1 Tax=Paenibacillus eucommiae TaxID=1355755 RepID=A0ABS4J027_9BACL|nr:AraC family transcriptional regulator [Paenibacillus eucommiae]MBP1992129.1 AraC-like DNA-binding protein [Paenibacillus eucommiae]
MNIHEPNKRAGQQPLSEQLEFNVELGALQFHVFINSGFFHTNSNWRILNHNHAMYEVQFVHKGTVVLSLEDSCHEVPEGSFCVIPPGVYHSQQSPSSGEEVHKSCFSFRCDVLPHPKADYPPDVTDELFRAFVLMNTAFYTTQDRQGTAALLAAIKQELNTKPFGYFFKVQSLFAQILVDVIRSSPGIQASIQTDSHSELAPQTFVDNRLIIIETFFSEHFDLPLREDDLAGQLYVSHRQLNRILHDLYGMSFRRKLLSTRMKVAMDLLKHTTLSVKDIAARVGYPFAENFHANFKAHTNMTPIAFRNYTASRPE